jgi:hypothetical protein
MADQCRLTGKRIDGNVVRATALLVLLAAGSYLVTSSPWIAVVLALDFLCRGTGLGSVSPFAAIARFAVRRLGIRPRPTDAGPKLFAARLGLGMTVAILALGLADLHTPALALAGMLAGCAALEGLAGYCVGCRIQSAILQLRGLSRAGNDVS